MKLTNIIFIIIGLEILFFLAGLNTSVGYTLGVLNLANDPQGIIGGGTYVLILGILAAAATAGIYIGFLTKSPVENLLIIPIVIALAAFLGDLVSIISTTNAACGVGSSCRWITWVVTAIIVPVAFMFLTSLVDWWRGVN